MYTFDSRIRYSETDSEGVLSLESLIDYFQDCSTFQSEDLGIGLRYLDERSQFWVLSSWQIEVERMPRLCERVTVGTFPYAFRSCFGYRNFFMKDEAGSFLAKANSLWTLLEKESFKPARPYPEMVEKYKLEEKLDMPYSARKITVPQDGRYEEEFAVTAGHLDVNHHVNNGQYIRMAMSVLPERIQVRSMRAEYKKQARLHAVIHPYVAVGQSESGAECYTVSLQGEDGGAYAVVEFVEEKK